MKVERCEPNLQGAHQSSKNQKCTQYTQSARSTPVYITPGIPSPPDSNSVEFAALEIVWNHMFSRLPSGHCCFAFVCDLCDLGCQKGAQQEAHFRPETSQNLTPAPKSPQRSPQPCLGAPEATTMEPKDTKMTPQGPQNEGKMNAPNHTKSRFWYNTQKSSKCAESFVVSAPLHTTQHHNIVRSGSAAPAARPLQYTACIYYLTGLDHLITAVLNTCSKLQDGICSRV